MALQMRKNMIDLIKYYLSCYKFAIYSYHYKDTKTLGFLFLTLYSTFIKMLCIEYCVLSGVSNNHNDISCLFI